MSLPRTDKGERKNPLFGQFAIANRYPAARTSYCRMVVFHYTKQNFGTASNVRGTFPDSTVFKTKQFTIEEEIKSMRVSKSLDNPSATFSVSLFPTQNWKETIAPGDWVGIYMFNRLETKRTTIADSKNLVMLGNVDRISRNLERDEDDKITLKYDVSGRNFGKVFEDINIWFDPYINQDESLDVALRTAGLEMTGNPTSQVSELLKIFLGPGGKFKGRTLGKEVTGNLSSLNQFRVPEGVAAIFNKTPKSGVVDPDTQANPRFYGILDQNIESGLPGYRDRNVISAEDQGNLWENLQRASNDLVNELFLEEIRFKDGFARPALILRPRPLNTPFFDSQFGKKELGLKSFLNGKYKTLQTLSDESFVEITQGEITLENLGRDDHSRFNMFWLTSNRDMQWNQSSYSNVRSKGVIGNPFFTRESVSRYGLKGMNRQFEFSQVSKKPTSSRGEASSDTTLFKALMVQAYDQNYANHLYDSGTIETNGVLEAELGKVLVILPNSNSGQKKKIYYIQGYEHDWTFPNTWRTTFTVTHGQYKTTDQKIFIDIGKSESGDFGSIDEAFDSVYIAKTQSDNKDKKKIGGE